MPIFADFHILLIRTDENAGMAAKAVSLAEAELSLDKPNKTN